MQTGEKDHAMNEALTKGVFAETAKGDLSPEQIVVSNLNGTGLWGSFPGSQGADKTQLAGFTSHHPSRAESSCPDTADEGLAHDEFVSDEPCVSLWAEIRSALTWRVVVGVPCALELFWYLFNVACAIHAPQDYNPLRGHMAVAGPATVVAACGLAFASAKGGGR